MARSGGLLVAGFGSGVVLTGAVDQRPSDALDVADGYDLDPQGALVAASDVTDYVTLEALDATALLTIDKLALFATGSFAQEIVLGEGPDLAHANAYLVGAVPLEGSASPVVMLGKLTPRAPISTPMGFGHLVTATMLPGIFQMWDATLVAVRQVSVMLINVGAREGAGQLHSPLYSYGLHVLAQDISTGDWLLNPIDQFDALGTGPKGSLAVSSLGVHVTPQATQLRFRGIAVHNGMAFGWGFDAADVNFNEGPARLMFSAESNPLKWGNDNQAAATSSRLFTDSDAIIIGDAGEVIRGAISWAGRLWIGTNRRWHFLAGFGRQSFQTDGARPVAKSENVVGPNAVCEGPDGMLYGVGDNGLWAFNGDTFVPLHQQLRDYRGHSVGYWDLLWNDSTAGDAYPGQTNADLVWCIADWETRQIIVGIPFCNATAGYGVGTDTVLIKFHTLTGGFTRQVFAGATLTAADFLRRNALYSPAKFIGAAAVSKLKRYAYRATPASDPVLPSALPTLTTVEHAPFGVDGVGHTRRAYVTLEWSALPLVLRIYPRVDGVELASVTLLVQATTPTIGVDAAEGDFWLDTSQTDTNLGNATAGAIIPANGGYLLKEARRGVWVALPGMGMHGTRATVRLSFASRRAVRTQYRLTCVSAAGRYQIEALGDHPVPVANEA